MQTQGMRAMHIRQIPHAHVTTIMYHPLHCKLHLHWPHSIYIDLLDLIMAFNKSIKELSNAFLFYIESCTV